MDRSSKSKTKFLDKLEDVIGTDELIKLDRHLGLRGWGLILYGVIPSNLALLGFLDVKVTNIDNLPLFFVLTASILPLTLIFMLIRDGNKKWYLTKDPFNQRSFLITFLIFFISVSIIGFSGMIQGKYIFGIPQNLKELKAIIECFLSAISSLVISSSFFLLAFTKKADLPGLPSLSFEESMKELDKKIREIKAASIWSEFAEMDCSFTETVKGTEKILSGIISSKGNNLAKISLKKLQKDMTNFISVLEKIDQSGSPKSKMTIWKIYFGISNELTGDMEKLRNKDIINFNSIQRLKKLEIED